MLNKSKISTFMFEVMIQINFFFLTVTFMETK